MKFNGCNCDISVHAAYYKLEDDFDGFPDKVAVHINLFGRIEELIISPGELTAKCFLEKFKQLRFKSLKDRREFDERILEVLYEGLDRGTIENGYYIEKTGAITMPNGKLIFARGDEIIGNVSRPVLLNQRFQGTRLLGSGDSLSALMAALRNAPKQVLLVFAYVIFASVRSVLVEAGIDFQGVLYIEGGQGLGKTTLAKRMAGIYKKNGKPYGIIQAGSSHASVNDMMSQMRDQTIIVDDLCMSASKSVQAKREELVAKLIRQGTSEEPITKKHGKETIELPCEASLIFTAEFPLDNESDLTRCIIVPVHKKLNLSEDLQPALVGDAVRIYSKWFSEHSEEVVQYFHRAVNFGIKTGYDKRIDTNYACMAAAMNTFLRCASDCGVAGLYSEIIRSNMMKEWYKARERHEELINNLKMLEPEGNLAYCILKGSKDKRIKLVDKDHREELNKAKVDGIKWEGDLCFKQASLMRLVHMQPGYKDWSRMEILNELNNMGALYTNETDRYNVKLADGLPRVYRIRKDVLKKAEQKY